MIRLTWRIYQLFDAAGRARLLALFGAMLVSTLLEVASIGLVVPFVKLLVDGRGSSLGQQVCRVISCESDRQFAVTLIMLFGGFFVVKSVALVWVTNGVNKVTNGLLAGFCQRMFALYLDQPYGFHLGKGTPELLRNLHTSVPLIFEGVRLILGLVLEGLMVAGTLAVLLVIAPVVTATIAVTIGVFGYLYQRIGGPAFEHYGERMQAMEQQVIRSITETFGAVKEVKLSGREPFFRDRYRRATDALSHYLTKFLLGVFVPRIFVEVLVVVLLLGILMVHLVSDRPVEEALTVLSLLAMASLRLMPSLNRILQNMSQLRHKKAPTELIAADLAEGLRGRADEQARLGAAEQPLRFEHDVRFESVCVRYAGADKNSLTDVDLTIRRGESVALVGTSGAGKTTIANLLLGLLRPSAGRLVVDGVELEGRLAAWRRRIGYVPQQSFLLDDTIRRNIAFGVDDDAIDDERVERAARMACLEIGLDLQVGENGQRLSGGQRQRIAIARALYGDPEMLILDEATSALDAETESAVTSAINALRETKTLVIIAHRLSTVKSCDRIHLMRDGRIVASGSFAELVAGNDEFRRMVELMDLSAEVPE